MWWNIRKCTNSVVFIIVNGITMYSHSDNGMPYFLHSTVEQWFFFKRTSLKPRCSVFHLLTPTCSWKPNSGIFPGNFPDPPPTYLPPFTPGYFQCPYPTLSQSLMVLSILVLVTLWHCIVIVCHFLTCVLSGCDILEDRRQLYCQWLAWALDLAGAQQITAEWMGFLPFLSVDIDDEDHRCNFYLTSNSQISQIPHLHKCLFFCGCA